MAGRAPGQDPETVLAYVVDNFDQKDKLSLARRLRDRLHLTRDTTYVSQVQGFIGRPLVAREKFVIRALETQISLAFPDYAYHRASRLGRVAVGIVSGKITRKTAKKTAKKVAKKTAKKAAKKTAKKASRKSVKRAARKSARR